MDKVQTNIKKLLCGPSYHLRLHVKTSVQRCFEPVRLPANLSEVTHALCIEYFDLDVI